MIHPVTQVYPGKGMIHVESKLSRRTIKSSITVSRDLEKYFRHFNFNSKYDEEIFADESILNIPALSILLPLAWITGSDVYLDELDRIFAESMNALQQEYKKMYPKAPFKTKLIADRLVDNLSSLEGVALLFSGGVDSTYSLYSNMHLNPRLITILGTVDIPFSNVGYQEMIKKEYLDFAGREGVKLNYVLTNALDLFDHDRLRHLWGRFQEDHEGDFWNGIGYSLCYVGHVAPLSVGRFSQLLFAASYFEDSNTGMVDDSFLEASSPQTDEMIRWGDFNVKHDGLITRYEKLQTLKPLLLNNRVKLRVCLVGPKYHDIDTLNCNTCFSCLQNVGYLLSMGVDPNDCGFIVDASTFKLMRFIIEKKLMTKHQIDVWEPLQKKSPQKAVDNLLGSDLFFDWFREVDLDSMWRPYRTPLFSLYFKLPYLVSRNLKKMYEFLRGGKSRYYESLSLLYNP